MKIHSEIWKPIVGYEGLYEVSNMGRVKSLAKTWTSGTGRVQSKNDSMLKPILSDTGYRQVMLYSCYGNKMMRIYWLVWDAFSDKPRKGFYVDHKNENKQDDNIDNLQLLSNRQNITKSFLSRKTASCLPIGVSRNRNKYRAMIRYGGKKIHLGTFNCPTVASIAYQKALKVMVGIS